jgi:hypothetical protein
LDAIHEQMLEFYKSMLSEKTVWCSRVYCKIV